MVTLLAGPLKVGRRLSRPSAKSQPRAHIARGPARGAQVAEGFGLDGHETGALMFQIFEMPGSGVEQFGKGCVHSATITFSRALDTE